MNGERIYIFKSVLQIVTFVKYTYKNICYSSIVRTVSTVDIQGFLKILRNYNGVCCYSEEKKKEKSGGTD